MKLLFVCNEFPYPPDNGVRIVSFNAIRLMSKAGHNISLAVLSSENHSDIESKLHSFSELVRLENFVFEQLKPRSKLKLMLESLLNREPYFVRRHNSVSFRRKLADQIKSVQPDCIHFDIITLSQYVDETPVGCGSVASINDSYALTVENGLQVGQYKGLAEYYRRFQLKGIKRYESKILQRFSRTHLMSKVDADYLKKLDARINCVVIPNGVDDETLTRDYDIKNNQCDLIFLAKLVGENLVSLEKFINEVWFEIKNNSADVILHVVGAVTPETELFIHRFKDEARIKFHGYVKNVSDVYTLGRISVVPINKNCGIVNKAIEAMAAGMVVVGFQKTFSALQDAEHNKHYIAASDYKSMAGEINKVLSNFSQLEKISQQAKVYAREHFDWSSRTVDYENMYLAAKRGSVAE